MFARCADHQARLDPLQVETDTARAHRDRHLLDLGGGEQELDVRGRLLQRLEERVEGLLRQHVHFIDDVDLGAGRDRAIARILDDLAHVVDAGVRGCVHLDHIDMARVHDRLAVDAEFGHVDARRVDLAGHAIIEGAGENARDRRLAGAADPGENVGLVDAVDGEGVGEDPHGHILADEVLETLRPVFARKHPVAARGRRRREATAPRPVRQETRKSLIDCPLGVRGDRRGGRWSGNPFPREKVSPKATDERFALQNPWTRQSRGA